MICMSPARGPWFYGLWLPLVKWFEFLCLPKACAKEGLMIEKKYFTAAIATINGAGPILEFSGLCCLDDFNNAPQNMGRLSSLGYSP